MKRIILVALCLAAGMLNAQAQKKNVVLDYDFSRSKGDVVRDRGPHHADARLMNGASVADKCLVLDTKDAYLDMTAKAGEVVNRLSDFTVYMRYHISPDTPIRGNGYFLWCFSALAANKEKDGPYHAYRVNQQRVETSVGGWSQETGIQKDCVTEQGKWISVVFRQSAGRGELYINGQLVGTESGFPHLQNIFTSAPQYNWIGRAPFAGDNYLSHARISHFRIYNKCLSDREMGRIENS